MRGEMLDLSIKMRGMAERSKISMLRIEGTLEAARLELNQAALAAAAEAALEGAALRVEGTAAAELGDRT